MIETIFTCGPGGGLVGVIAEPDSARALPEAPAVLLWNVGLNHRVGPFRLFVDLARALADAGFTVLRLDLSGLGDSEVRKDAVDELERAALDVQEAMDALGKRRGFRRFMLVGFCSSVDAAHALAVRDDRVAGAVFIEGYLWPTRGSALRYPLRFLEVARWKRLLITRFERHFGDPARREGATREQVYLRDYPPLARFRREVREMLARGRRLLFVYVSGDSGYAYRRQFFDMMGGLEGADELEVEFYRDADHTFYVTQHRMELIARICQWARASVGRAPLEETPRSSATG